jgi:hypothetical protein
MWTIKNGFRYSICCKKTKLRKTSVSKYKESDYITPNGPAIVQCIDPKLKSIYLHKGVVQQVIPLSSTVEIDVDFGNHIIRLEESQIEII